VSAGDDTKYRNKLRFYIAYVLARRFKHQISTNFVMYVHLVYTISSTIAYAEIYRT